MCPVWQFPIYIQLVGCLGGCVYSCALYEAKLFLSRVHQDTSGADLESGALGLKTDLKGLAKQRKQLVKDNFDCFVSCKTTIDGIMILSQNRNGLKMIPKVQGLLTCSI